MELLTTLAIVGAAMVYLIVVFAKPWIRHRGEDAGTPCGRCPGCKIPKKQACPK